jgi:hypothetical protein
MVPKLFMKGSIKSVRDLRSKLHNHLGLQELRTLFWILKKSKQRYLEEKAEKKLKYYVE